MLNCVPALIHMTGFTNPSSAADPALPITLLKFCRQVAESLSYLAGKSFVRRDIAARNILLDQELNCKVKTNCLQWGRVGRCLLSQYIVYGDLK